MNQLDPIGQIWNRDWLFQWIGFLGKILTGNQSYVPIKYRVVHENPVIVLSKSSFGVVHTLIQALSEDISARLQQQPGLRGGYFLQETYVYWTENWLVVSNRVTTKVRAKAPKRSKSHSSQSNWRLVPAYLSCLICLQSRVWPCDCQTYSRASWDLVQVQKLHVAREGKRCEYVLWCSNTIVWAENKGLCSKCIRCASVPVGKGTKLTKLLDAVGPDNGQLPAVDIFRCLTKRDPGTGHCWMQPRRPWFWEAGCEQGFSLIGTKDIPNSS